MKKLLVSLLCVMMMASFMPAMAWAEGEVADGVECNGQDCTHVATVGEKHYTTFANAINAADGNTVTVLKECAIESSINVTKSLTIDLNGKTVTGLSNAYSIRIYGSDVQVVLKDSSGSTGKITSARNDSGAAVQVADSAKLRMESGMIEVTGADGGCPVLVIGSGLGIGTNAKGASFEMVGGTLSANGYFALAGNGTWDGTYITISGGTIKSEKSGAIYHPQEGNLTLNGGTISGTVGVQVCGGELSIPENSTVKITATGADNRAVKTGDGLIEDGAAVSIVSRGGGYGDVQAAIANGSFVSEQNKAILSYAWKDNQVVNDGTKIEKFISGGTFNTNPSEHIAEDNIVRMDSENSYVVLAKKGLGMGTYLSDPSGSLASSNYYAVKNDDETWTVYYNPPVVTPPTEPEDNVTNNNTSTGDKNTTADIKPTVPSTDGKVEATVDKETADKIVEKAVENGSTEVVIDAGSGSTTTADKVASAEVKVPTETMQSIVEKTDATVTIKTDAAEVTMDRQAVEAVATQAAEAKSETVALVVEKTKDETKEMNFELSLVTETGKVSDFNGGKVSVTVKLNATLKDHADENLVCVYIDDNGIYTKVEGKKNADGTYTFVTGHFSTYAIMSAEEADKIIKEQQIAAVKAFKITTKTELVKGKKMIIKWTVQGDESAIDGYRVYYSTKKADKGFKVLADVKGKKLNHTSIRTNKNIKKGTRVYYRVKAFKKMDGKRYLSDYSSAGQRTWK